MSRSLVFDPNGWEDHLSWQTQDRKTSRRINALIADVLRDPFAGIGKPEQLRHVLAGAWSRRINETDRLVYYVTDDDDVVILQARDHFRPAPSTRLLEQSSAFCLPHGRPVFH